MRLFNFRSMSKEDRSELLRWATALCVLVMVCGCGQFFPPLSKTSGNNGGSGGGGGGGTSSGNFLYVGNVATNPLSVAEFSLSNGALSNISGSPLAVEVEPTSMVVTPNDQYLYVGSAAGTIYVYLIGSNGSLTLGNNGTPVATGVEPSVMRVDPTGKWLLGADAFAGEAYVFQIGSGGVLTAVSSSVVTMNTSVAATDMEITPNGAYVYVSCGTAGIYTLSFNSANGELAQINSVLTPKELNDADYGMAISPSGNLLFAAETGIGGVRIFSIGTGGTLKEVTGSPVKTAPGAYSVLVDSTGSYVYVANRAQGTISAFLLSNSGALTPISGSPFTTGSAPLAMVEDKTDSYIAMVCAGGNPDLQVFQFSTTTPGALVSLAESTTGVDPTEATSLAATH